MSFKDFWFSYKNILHREIEKKKYFTFIRRVFGVLFKFLIRYLRHKLQNKVLNLDKKTNQKDYFNLGFEKLFLNFNSDKGPFWYSRDKKFVAHSYYIFYEKYFRELKEKKINILEIGSHEGKGIASFFFFFPFSKIIGANINPFQMKFSSERIKELYIDVSSKKILQNFADHLNNEQDIIIDDASHNLRDILITLPIMFKKLKSGGIYVIEDMDQFEIFKELNLYKNEMTPKKILKKIQNKEYFKSSFIDENDRIYLQENISEIKMEVGTMIIDGKNASDIAFIFKK
tara:strand:+ start:1380 stop:2240 length:861 start_codon:yes stop_codon:yes gene_type:complete